jgi:hypothetical protein
MVFSLVVLGYVDLSHVHRGFGFATSDIFYDVSEYKCVICRRIQSQEDRHEEDGLCNAQSDEQTSQ